MISKTIQKKLKYVSHCFHQLIDEDKRKSNKKENDCIPTFILRSPHVTFSVDSKSRLFDLHLPFTYLEIVIIDIDALTTEAISGQTIE